MKNSLYSIIGAAFLACATPNSNRYDSETRISLTPYADRNAIAFRAEIEQCSMLYEEGIHSVKTNEDIQKLYDEISDCIDRTHPVTESDVDYRLRVKDRIRRDLVSLTDKN